MKKIKLSKTQSENIRWLCRFLKENDAYYRYFNHIEKWLKLKKTDIGGWKDKKMIDYIYEAYLACSYDDEDYFIWLNSLWLIFIYEHKLYGKSYTCSKKQLIEDVDNALFSMNYNNIENDEIKNKLSSILAKKNKL